MKLGEHGGDSMANILISTHWTDGDVYPFIRIGYRLKERGHHVTIFTHCYYEKIISDAGLGFVVWDNEEQYKDLMECMKGNIDTIASGSGIDTFREKFESEEVRLREYYKLLEHCTEKNTIIIAKNRSSIAALMIAEKLNIPIISVIMAPYELSSMLNYEQLFKDSIVKEMNQLRSKVMLPPIKSWLEWQANATRNIGLWPEWFDRETVKSWPADIDLVGFPLPPVGDIVSKELPESMAGFLENAKDIVLITGGTSKMLKENFYSCCIEACGIFNKPTIILTRYKELIPDKLPSNIIWCEYLPMDIVLPYIRVIIHHGGIGTIGEALRASVPQLILAHYVDRPYNAAKLQKIGLAEYLPPAKWKASNLIERLEKLMTPESLEKCKEYSEKIKNNDSIETICEIVEETL